MSKMTREDMLRELELLPVWQLRQPLSQPVEGRLAPTLVTSPDTLATSDTPVTTMLASPEVVIEASGLSQPLRAMASEDGNYLFLIQPAETMPGEDVAQLLQNMLRAMRVVCRTDTLSGVEQLFSQHAPKLVICLGAEPANLLLQQSKDMLQWRSHQPHSFKQIPLVVTFAPQHLVQHTQDKVLAWQDLCLAMQLMQSL